MLLTHAFGFSVLGQRSGNLKGTVRVASGAPISGVTVLAINQVTGKWKRTRSDAEGKYAFRLSAGAYRLKVTAPHVAKFDKDKTTATLHAPWGSPKM